MESVLNPRFIPGRVEHLRRRYRARDAAQGVTKPGLLCLSSRQLSNGQFSDSRTSLNSGLGSFKQA